jgi:hypothetical protein
MSDDSQNQPQGGLNPKTQRTLAGISGIKAAGRFVHDVALGSLSPTALQYPFRLAFDVLLDG